MRAIQQARKDAELDVSDRIRLTVEADSAETAAAIEAHRELVTGEVLAVALETRVVELAGVDGAVAVGDGRIRIVLERA